MSKYNKIVDSDSKPQLLQFIANELAEANRLKRLELKYTPIGNNWTPKIIEELEDKAV